MKYHVLVLLALFSLSFQGCQTDDNVIDAITHPFSGKIVIIEQFQELKVLEINNLKFENYGAADYKCRPVWSYDGTKIATFNNKQSSILGDTIIIVDTNNDVINLWKTDSRGGDITWSPDGRIIAYYSRGGINYLNIITGEMIYTKLSLPENRSVSAIAWHPSGEKISISANYSLLQVPFYMYQQSFYIYEITPYETSLDNYPHIATKSTEFRYRVNHMDWSLDGKKLLISKHNDDIYVLNYELESIRKIPEIIGSSACWSPDGSKILYVDWRWTSMNSAYQNLRITDENGVFDYDLKVSGLLVDWQ